MSALATLRAFVGASSTYSEADLKDCLQQTHQNVDRAAELLLTGQFVRTKQTAAKQPASHPHKTGNHWPTFSASKKPRSTTSPARISLTPRSEPPPLNKDHWLLCTRWLSNAVNTTRHGRLDYQEPLTVTHDKKGDKVRLKGARMEGYLPSRAEWVPLLKAELIVLRVSALMDARHLSLGNEVPVAVSVYLPKPERFFRVAFGGVVDEGGGGSYFSSTKKAPTTILSEAAFSLLQWAQYGESYDFAPPTEEGGGDVLVQEEEDDDEGSTAQAKEWENQVVGDDWAKALPEAEDPPGLQQSIELRPYQRQALHWMWHREQSGAARAQVDEELKLLGELHQQQQTKVQHSGPDPISCDCGPVLLSTEAQKTSRTLDGTINPVAHPLWQRRYLTNHDRTETLTFYVNELLGSATAVPPPPPQPCTGGILADAMGLGKTVMLLALILKAKAELKEENGTTLIVAKLYVLSMDTVVH